MAGLLKEWVPKDLFGDMQMRSQVSKMMVSATKIYVGFLLGREHTWRKAILKVWGRMSPSTRLQIMGLGPHEADLRATAGQIMHTFSGSISGVGPQHKPSILGGLEDTCRSECIIPSQLDSVGVAGGALV